MVDYWTSACVQLLNLRMMWTEQNRCELNWDQDTSRLSPARTRAFWGKIVSCDAEKKNYWKQRTAGTHSYWIDFISFLIHHLKKKNRSIASWVWRDAWSNFPEGKQDRAVKPCNVERAGSHYSSLSTQSRPEWRQLRYSSVTANGRRSSKVMHAWTTHASNISNNSKLIFRLLVG